MDSTKEFPWISHLIRVTSNDQMQVNIKRTFLWFLFAHLEPKQNNMFFWLLRCCHSFNSAMSHCESAICRSLLPIKINIYQTAHPSKIRNFYDTRRIFHHSCPVTVTSNLSGLINYYLFFLQSNSFIDPLVLVHNEIQLRILSSSKDF